MQTIEQDLETIEYNENKILYSWGFGKYGQIGLKFVNYSINPIKQVTEDNEEVFSISAGENHSAILTLSSKLYMYGKNYFGQLGLNHNHYVYSLTKMEFSERIKISKVVCGGDHTLAISEENSIYSWGLNVFGQLGLGDYLLRKQPTRVDLQISSENSEAILMKNEDIVDIAVGAQHSMLLTSKNRILTCGCAKFNSLGYESEEDVNIFKPVPGINVKSTINKISCGVYHSGCIVDNEYSYIWGNGEVLVYDHPTIISINSSSNNSENVQNSQSNSDNLLNQLNHLTSSPSKKVSPYNMLRDIKFGDDTVYLLNKNDEIFCMGDNKYGQLGDKSTISRKHLEKISLMNIKCMEVGYTHVLVITFDNKIYGWGSNEYGQLGTNKSNIILEPTLIDYLSSLLVYKITCGGYHSLGLFNNDISKEEAILAKSSTLNQLKVLNSTVSLNSTIKNDLTQLIDKAKLVETLKKKLSDMENTAAIKTSFLKDLKQKEEEIKKKIDESKDPRKSLTTTNNPRGFDNTFQISLEEIEFASDEGDIGKGTFGDVKRGIWRKEQVAVKFLKQEMTNTSNSEDNINAFIEECNMLKNLRHPNILLFMGFCVNPPVYFVVTEFCENGNLFELLHQHTKIPLSWEDNRRMALEIALGMNYLHSFEPPILHRDLKSMNVLLDRNMQVKIADFGSTKFLEVQMTKQKGTFQWMAPEVIKGSSYTEKADVFSYGIIMHELASRKPPYYGDNKKDVARNVATKPDYRPAISRSFPKEWVDLMVKCWDHSASKRPNFAEIIDKLMNMKFR